MTGESPDRWLTLPLARIVSVQKGRIVPTSPSALPGYQPYLGAATLDGSTTEFADPAKGVRCTSGDVLMLWDGERSGLVGRGRDGVVASTVARLTPRELVVAPFLYHQLARHFSWIQNQRTGTGVPHVPSDLTTRLRIRLPRNVAEQRCIANILDTLDDAIRVTEQLIVKLQHVKQGLLRDLLTRGIDDNGELRDPACDPGSFMDSPLGRIPRHWQVLPVECLLAVDAPMRSGPFGSALLKSELVASGIPLLGIDNVQVERFVGSFNRYVTPKKAATLSRYRVRPGDVMITIMGTVGRCCVVPDTLGEALSSKHVWTLTFDQARYSAYLACLQFNYAPWVLRHFSRDEQGGIMSAIRSETLRTTLLPVPPSPEIRAIEQIMSAAGKRIWAEKTTLEKLKMLKQGMMEDLLSGRYRVTDLSKEGA